MQQIISYNWNGTPIYGDENGQPLTTSKDMVVTAKKSTGGNGETMNSIFSAIPGFLNGVASIVGAAKGIPFTQESVNQPPPEATKDYTMWYVIGFIILLVVLFLIFKK